VLAVDGDRLVAAGGAVPGQAIPNLGAQPQADRAVDAGASVLATGGEALAAADRALAEWQVLTAAQLCGAGRRAVDIAVAYTTERRQFGVQIASFQTIAHRLADAATAMDGATLLMQKAAWAADEDPGAAATLASMAFAYAGEAAELAATEALHFHGGYGFMLEYDIQLYFRRIKAWSLVHGDRQLELRRLADHLWGPAAPTSAPVAS
jgi:alkylation response protein AidB-like acyl-CoA dehydrogenase